jgi:hypothetical protein
VANDGNASDRRPFVSASPSDNVKSGIDRVVGGLGNDTLEGNALANTLEGGQGTDTLRGLAGNDQLLANDGQVDIVACGEGADFAQVDLKDRGPQQRGFPDCEAVQQAAVDQHPNVRIGRRWTLDVGRRLARIELRCPRELRRGCRGAVTLVAGRRGNSPTPRAGRGRYRRIAPGGRRSVAVPISPRALRVLRRGGALRAAAEERDSRGRPKLTLRTLSLRRVER